MQITILSVALIPTLLAGSPAGCPDTNADGLVDSQDLNDVLGAFGCMTGCGSADLDADGDVDSDDLNLVLGAFGSECEPLDEGACCFGDDCLSIDEASCAIAQGSFLGVGTTCDDCETTPAPTGPCCFGDDPNECSILTLPECIDSGGVFLFDGTSCDNCDDDEDGACCLATGGCIDTSPMSCLAQLGNVYLGDSSDCDDEGGQCGPAQAIGACCTGALCFTGPSTDCAAIGGVYQGNNTDCDACAVPESAPCCLGDDPNECEVLTESECAAMNGVYLIAGGACAQCDDDEDGACCLAGGGCIDISPMACLAQPGNVYLGDSTDCEDNAIDCP